MEGGRMAQSKVFEHCVALYKGMEERAYTNDAGDQIYRGFLSKLLQQELGLPVSYYSKLKTVLEDQGCIIQQRRGGGTSPSEWKLVFPPDHTAFSQRIANPAFSRRARTQSQELYYAMARLSERLTLVEDKVEILIREFANGDNRLGNSKSVSEVSDPGDGD